jgi:hypothetical protein
MRGSMSIKLIVTSRNFAYACNKIVPRLNTTLSHSTVSLLIPLSLLALTLSVGADVSLSLNFALMLNVAVGRCSGIVYICVVLVYVSARTDVYCC